MNIKNEILLKSGLEALKESPIKRTLPKTKKIIKEKVKLNSILNDLLLEAVELNDAKQVLRALERGQIPGVKKKEFLKTALDQEEIESALNKTIKSVNGKANPNDINKYLMLLFKRAERIDTLHKLSEEELSEIVDSASSFFNNRNKKEVKENEEIKKKFEEYESSKIDFKKDKEFEQWANDKFAQKARAKDDDVEEIYNDGEWTVNIPKTFAAASKLACTNNKKARWCTSASNDMYKYYTRDGNKLFIIRNDKRDIMYQMDWGARGNPNFMSETDSPETLEKILALNIPENLWKSIKNKDEESVYDKLEPAIETKKVFPFDDTDKTPADKLEGWMETVFITLDDFMKEIEGKKIPNIFNRNYQNMRDVLSGTYASSKKGAKRIAKYEKDGKTFYHLVPGENGFNLGRDAKTVYQMVLSGEGSRLDYVRTDELVKSDLPSFFTEKGLEKTEKTSGDLEGWNEHVYTSMGDFLKEIANFEMPKMVGSADNFTKMLKSNVIEKIGKISKGKKIYYYIIAKPGDEFRFSRNERGAKAFQRVALQLTNDKLTVKTGQSIMKSDLPLNIKKKLFSFSRSGIEQSKQLDTEDLKKPSKSELPILFAKTPSLSYFKNVDTFSKLGEVPNIKESTFEFIKKLIMNKVLNLRKALAFITSSDKKYVHFALNNGSLFTIENDGGKPIDSVKRLFKGDRYYRDGLSFKMKFDIYDTVYKNSNIFDSQEKKFIENARNDEPFKRFRNGFILRVGPFQGRVFLQDEDRDFLVLNQFGHGIKLYSNLTRDLTDENRGLIEELNKEGFEEIAQKLLGIF